MKRHYSGPLGLKICQLLGYRPGKHQASIPFLSQNITSSFVILLSYSCNSRSPERNYNTFSIFHICFYSVFKIDLEIFLSSYQPAPHSITGWIPSAAKSFLSWNKPPLLFRLSGIFCLHLLPLPPRRKSAPAACMELLSTPGSLFWKQVLACLILQQFKCYSKVILSEIFLWSWLCLIYIKHAHMDTQPPSPIPLMFPLNPNQHFFRCVTLRRF